MSEPLPYVVLGAGGHAKVVIETLRAQGREVVAVVATQSSQALLDGVSVVIAENLALERWSPSEIQCVVGIGSVGDPTLRVSAFRGTRTMGFLMGTAVHPSAVISRSVLAFITPPTPSIASLTARAVGQLSVPLKGRCSMKWDTPASLSDSYLDPAPTQMTMETDWVWSMVDVRTRSLLSSTERWYMYSSNLP